MIWQLKTKGTVTFPWSVNQKYDQKWKIDEKLIFLLLWPIDWFVKKPYRCHVSGHHSFPLKKAMAILTNIVKISPNHGKLKWNTALDNPRNGLQTFIKLSLISQQHKLRFKNAKISTQYGIFSACRRWVTRMRWRGLRRVDRKRVAAKPGERTRPKNVQTTSPSPSSSQSCWFWSSMEMQVSIAKLSFAASVPQT